MNQEHCRFTETLHDLADCWEHIDDTLSPDEDRARTQLLALVQQMAEEAEERP